MYWLSRDEAKKGIDSSDTRKRGRYIDPTGKKNGRGAYICPNRVCLEKAFKSRGLERSFKMKVPEEIYVSLQKELGQLDE